MENYETILENLLSFFFEVVNYNNEKVLILKYSTYDRFPEELIDSVNQIHSRLAIIQSNEDKETKLHQLKELKDNIRNDDIRILGFYDPGVVIRNTILELATLQQEVAFRKINFIESLLNSVESLNLNPADPVESFMAFFTSITQTEFNYIGPDYLSINKLKIPVNLIDDIAEDIINRIEIINKIKTGLNRAFAKDTIQSTSLGIGRITEKKLNRLDAGLLNGELPFIEWYEINNAVQTTTRSPKTKATVSANLSLNDFLNDTGKKIISNLKTEYTGAKAARFYKMLEALEDLDLLKAKRKYYTNVELTNMINSEFPNSPSRTAIFPSPGRVNKSFKEEKTVIQAMLDSNN